MEFEFGLVWECERKDNEMRLGSWDLDCGVLSGCDFGLGFDNFAFALVFGPGFPDIVAFTASLSLTTLFESRFSFDGELEASPTALMSEKPEEVLARAGGPASGEERNGFVLRLMLRLVLALRPVPIFEETALPMEEVLCR